jgi:hypothetical protein
MFDDYSLRLLGEMGIDVYLPRDQAAASEPAHAIEPPALRFAEVPREDSAPAVKPEPRADAVAAKPAATAEVLVLCRQREPNKLLGDLLRALRAAGLQGDFGEIEDLSAISSARGLVVLGETIVREIGPGLSAQQQNAITWVVAMEPVSLARSADSKRALWGEIKRLSRTLARSRPVV